MARPLRIEFPGAVYLVSDTGLTGRSIIQSDNARLQFLTDLTTVATNLDWSIYSWCMLPDSYSFVVETPHGDLGTGMRWFSSNYARHMNHQNKCSGRVFRGPYRAVLMEPDVWLLPVCRHVVLQPVASAVVATPEECPWSSYQATVMSTHVRSAPLAAESLLSRFGRTREEAVAAYADYIRAGIGQPTPLTHVMPPGILGTPTFVQVVTEQLVGRTSEPAVAATLLMLARPSLAQIFGPDAKRERSQLPLRVAAAVHLGYSLVQIASQLGVHYTTVSRYLRTARGGRKEGFLPPTKPLSGQ